jgi:hypothetical protein
LPTLRPVIRSRVAVAAAVLMLAGCGASDEQDVARVLESYPHALAAGDAQAACDTYSPQAQRAQVSRPGGLCAYLRHSVSRLTPAERRRLAAARAVRVKVKGARATGYLQFGQCILTVSGSELQRTDAGDWQIIRHLDVYEGMARCLR